MLEGKESAVVPTASGGDVCFAQQAGITLKRFALHIPSMFTFMLMADAEE